MSTLKLNSFFVDIKRNFRVDLKNVDLNNYTLFISFIILFLFPSSLFFALLQNFLALSELLLKFFLGSFISIDYLTLYL